MGTPVVAPSANEARSSHSAATGAGRQAPRASRRLVAILFSTGGLGIALGGQLHPHGHGDTVDAHLLSMFESPAWAPAHWVLLVGSVLAAAGLVVAWRRHTFGPSVQRWLPAASVAWVFGALEVIPHLLAAGEAHALEHHEATPVLDLHVLLQVASAPLVGISGAVVAVLVARAARTRPAWVLAVVGVIGGLGYAASAPLLVATGNVGYTVLFPFQAGLALWLLGTGIRLLRR